MTLEEHSWTCRPGDRPPVTVRYFSGGGEGETILFCSGFATGAESYLPLLRVMPPRYRLLALELDDGRTPSPAQQAELLKQFIRDEEGMPVTVVAHALAGFAAVEALSDPEIQQRCSRLILIAGAGLNRELPELSFLLDRQDAGNPLRRQVDFDLRSYLLLSLLFHDESRISDEAISHLSSRLRRHPDTVYRLAAAAGHLANPDPEAFTAKLERIRLPALVIWGASDPVLPLPTAWEFSRHLGSCPVEALPYCGHLPHLEFPERTAALIDQFMFTSARPAAGCDSRAEKSAGKIRLRRLVDHWTLSTAAFILFLKILQLLRKLGVKAEENGWRKATGIFMRNEYSKFILTTFRLRYYQSRCPVGYQQARRELARRLAAFLHRQPSFHWSAEPGLLSLGRRRTFFCDIVEAHYTADGRLERLEPHFDDQRGNFDILTSGQIDAALQEVIRSFNILSKASGRHRAILMAKRMRHWAKRYPNLKYAGRTALRLLVDRLMTATYLHCEILPGSPVEAQRMRLRTPNLRRYRHPGWGLLNIFCRFTPDLKEVDLWVQFHHVPVDGAPMQELLDQLKNEWGVLGPIRYPAGAVSARPEIFHCGDRLFRARFYVNFEKLLQLRNFLNRKYCEETAGPITIAGMILWGLSRHGFFHDRKMLFPVDSSVRGDHTRERELSLAFIRPGKFDTPEVPLRGFLAFQREFNGMIAGIRAGRSESEEFLELCSMTPPIVYHIADWVVPHALREIVGTVGVSIIKDAEMFISPLSDFQTGGFMAIGNLTGLTEDGERVGAVSVCASRSQVREYYEAVTRLAEFYADFLQIADRVSSE